MVRGGNAHFFTYTRIRSRETGENKTDEQTRTKLGVNQEQRKVCNTTCMCRLSLAWVTSENSTSNSNADILRLNLLHWTLSCLLLSPESSVDCPCPWFHANSLLFASLLSSRQLPSAGSRRQRPPAVQRQLPSAGSRRQLPPAVQRQLPSAGSRRQLPPAVQRQLPSAGLQRQLSFASPYHFRIRRDFMSKNPLSGFAPKQTKESSALVAHSYSATTGLNPSLSDH